MNEVIMIKYIDIKIGFSEIWIKFLKKQDLGELFKDVSFKFEQTNK